MQEEFLYSISLLKMYSGKEPVHHFWWYVFLLIWNNNLVGLFLLLVSLVYVFYF